MKPAGNVNAGEVLGQRYTLRRALWTSALGPVWEARDAVLARTVAVQLLHPEAARDDAISKRLQRAAAAIAQVTHPGIARIFDIGIDPPFVVFELGGTRLSDRLERGPMRTTDAARTALSLAGALEALHAAGLTHGSVGPAAVMLDAEGRARLISLGAVATSAEASGAGPHEQPDGYRPPEPAPPDAGDRYALAALTYHMVTGRTPAEGAGARRLALPPAITALLGRALSADPVARPSLDAFVAGLGPFARVDPPKARSPRRVAAEFRWLVPALLIVVLAAVALTFGGRAITSLTRDPDPAQSPSEQQSFAPGDAIPVASVADFDPHGSDGEENPEDTARAIDGDPTTAWTTLNYVNAGFDKAGVGLLFDLGQIQTISAVRVTSDLAGWRAQIRIGESLGDDETAFTRLKTFTSTGEDLIELPAGATARYVLLWAISGADRGTEELPFRAEFAEVEFFAA